MLIKLHYLRELTSKHALHCISVETGCYLHLHFGKIEDVIWLELLFGP